jgi:drug/metabolite transporter (DMT)-like permease
MSRARIELWAALWVVYLVWGSTYLGIKLAVRTLPPLLTGGTRFLAAAVVLAGILTVARRSLRASRREALSAAGLGVALLACGVGLVHVAETRIDSGVAAMIAGSVPLQIVVWRALARERVPRATVLAAAIGIVGLALVVGPDGIGGGSVAVGLLIMVVASLSWSRGSFVARRLSLPRDPFVATVYEMIGGGTVLVLAGLVAGEGGQLDGEALQPGPIAAWAYLAVVGSVVGFSAYAWLLRNAPISQVVTHQYVNPLVAVALGALLLGERPGPATLAGAALIIGAVAVTARYEGRTAAAASDSSPAERPAQGARAATAEAGDRAPEAAVRPRPASAAPRGTRAGRSA